MNKNPFLSWQFMLLKVIALALVALFLEKPVGSVSGRVSLEESGFHLSSFDIRNNHVYVVATGSGKNSDVELGTWVNPDGSFKINQLPVGEYSVKIRATGFETEYRNGAFVYDGKITDVGDAIRLSLLTPSVTIASNTRVYNSKEHPYFWINATGATDATVKLYKVNVLNYVGSNPDEPAPEETTNAQNNSEEDNHPGETTVPDKGKPNFGTNMELYKPYDSAEKSVLSLKEKPYKTLTRHLENSSDDWARADFKLDPLPRGDYFAVAEIKNQKGQSDWNMIWFNVSDIGLIMKTDNYKAVVQAIDLNDLHPVKDVAVNIYDRKNQSLKKLGKTAKTDESGFAELPLNGLPAGTILAVGTSGTDRAYSGIYGSGGVKDSERYHAYWYTDRPVYRLGQTVFFKTICRENYAKGLRTPATNLPIHVSVQDPDNNNIWEGNLHTNDHGCIAGSVKIPDESKTGGYSVLLTYADGSQENESFEVAEYRKPEYEVTVKAITPHVVAGSKAKMSLKASYYFGAPVANAKISYSIYSASDWGLRWRLLPRPAYMSYFDDWDSDDDDSSGEGGEYNSYSYGGDFLVQGNANTDANGEATIEFDTTRPQYDATSRNNYDYSDKRYRVECEVTDLSRMSVTSSANLSVTMADFAIFSETDSYVYKAGDPVRANITAVDYLAKPVVNQTVTASLVRWAYDLSTHDYKDREIVKTAEVVTDSAGKATVSFPTAGDFATDTYRVVVTASDKYGRTVTDQDSVWIASSVQPFFSFGEQAQKEPLTIRLDKKAYKIGDTAKIMISGPITGKEGIQAFVSLESDSLLKYWTLPMDASAKMIELPIEGSFEPNIYVSVAFATKDHQFYHESKSIRVSPAEHFLNLKIATDKPKYSPGETVHYKVKATLPDGKPSPNTELSLGLVDESIYAIRAENAPDIVKFFFKKRSNSVNTICSFPEQYSGGPDKIEPRVRKDFKDTAVWIPSLKTNAEGIAIADVKLPDNLTTWRATVRAASIGNEFGSATNKIISSQDFIVRLALPRFFTTGDEGLVTAIVHNYTDSAQQAKVSLTLSNQLHTDQSLTTTLSIGSGGASRYSWPVKAVSVGQAVIGIKATGSKSGDAMETKLPIIPLGIPAFSAVSGVLRDDPAQVTIPVGLTSDAVPGTTKYNLTVASSSIGPVLGNFDSLIQYPYGCVEQTMSRLMPSVVALTLNKKLNIPITAEQSKLFAKVYKISMAKLDGYQHADGGWGWWETDESNLYLTSLVLEGYKRLEGVKYPVDAERKKNGLAWLSKNTIRLQQQLIDPHKAATNYWEGELFTDLARGCYTLALHGQKPNDKVMVYLNNNIHRLPAEALAYLSMADHLSKSDAPAKSALDELISLANQRGDNCVWTWDSRVTAKRLGLSAKQYVWYDFRFTEVETTALGLQAVLMVDPDNTDLIEKIKSWLLERRAVGGWENTKATAEVFMALLEEQLQFSKGKQTNCTLDINEATNLLKEFVFNLTNQFGPEQNAKIAVPDKSENLILSKKGDGRIYYSSLLQYQRKLLPGDKIAAKSTPQGLSLSRTFFHIEPVATTTDGKMHFTHKPLTDNEIRAGETVLMKVTLDNPIGLPYIMLECALPSGAEVVQDGSEAQAVNSEESAMGDWNRAWWTHQDVLDDRIVFFVTHLQPGKSEFNTLLRMEMPGKFQINPIKMEGMYTNKVRGYSELGTVTVKE